MSLGRFSVERPVLVSMAVGMIMLLGAIALSRLPIDLMPDITNPTISVTTSYANAGPQEIEELVTRPVEEAVSAVPGVEQVTSVSADGNSSVRVTFSWGADLDAAANDLRDRIDRIIPRLPDDVERPSLRKFDLAAAPIMFLGAASDLDPIQFRKIIDEQVKYRLERVPGVAALDVRGGVEREIHVLLDRDKVKGLGLSLTQILAELRRANGNRPAGLIRQGTQDVLVRTPGEFRTLDEIRATVVATRDGVPIQLGAIARVVDGWARLTRSVRVNGKGGIQLTVSKQSGTNTVEVADGIFAELREIARDIPQITIIPIADSSRYIRRSISNIVDSVIQGGVLSVLILLFFLRDTISTFIITVSIPLSILATFVLIYFFGFTLNMMTLGGLALGVGMVVDNANVVVETIMRRIEEGGQDPARAAVEATDEVLEPVLASTLTAVVVFVPLVFVRGMAGIMFQQLAWVVSFSLIASLAVALTVVPMMSAYLLRRKEPATSFSGRLAERLEGWFQGLERRYSAFIRASMERRKATILLLLALGAGAAWLGPRIGVESMPAADESEVRVNAEMEAGVRLDVLDRIVRGIEEVVAAAVPERAGMISLVGGAGFRNDGTHTAEVRIPLVSRTDRTRSSEEVAADLRRKLTGIPGMVIRTRAGQGLFVQRLSGGANQEALQLEIRGHHIQTADELAVRVKGLLTEIPGVTDVRLSRESGSPEQLVLIDRGKAADLGLSVGEVAELLETAISGTRVGYLRESGDEYPLMVSVDGAEEMALSEVLDLTIQNREGIPVVLANVVSPEGRKGPARIERKDQERIVTVSANISGRDLGSVIADARKALATLPLPKDFTVGFGGDYEEQQKAFGELLLMLGLANLFVYMVMACQYESIVDPMVVMVSVPMAAIGVVVALFVTGSTFNIQSFIGCVLLGGIAVNNAIVLVDQIKLHRRRDRLPMVDAIVEAGRLRLRPILSTSLTTILGVLPLAMGWGDGGEAQAPLARAVLGGMTTATLITLLVIPVVYSLAEPLRREPPPAGPAKG